MMSEINKKLEDILHSDQSSVDKKQLILDELYERMKDDENLYEEVRTQFQNAWEQASQEPATHVSVQLDNTYRQAIRNFNKQLERAEFQRTGKAAKEALLAELEAIEEVEDWKTITRVLYELKDDWEDAAYAGKAYDAQLNTKFKQRFDEILAAKDAYFGNLQVNRQSAKTTKEDLIKQAQAASGSTRWKETSQQMKALMDEWKAAGNAGREENDILWEQFNAARQSFFEKQDVYFQEMRVRQEASLKAKEELIKEAQAICDSEDFKTTSEQMRELMTRWKKAGSAGRASEDALWEQFSQAREQFYGRQREHHAQRKGKFMDNLYEGIKRRNKQIADLEHINRDLEAQVSEIRNLEPVMGNQEDRWEITNQRNQEVAKLQEYINENLKKLADLQTQLNEMDDKYKALDDE